MYDKVSAMRLLGLILLLSLFYQQSSFIVPTHHAKCHAFILSAKEYRDDDLKLRRGNSQNEYANLNAKEIKMIEEKKMLQNSTNSSVPLSDTDIIKQQMQALIDKWS